MTTMTLKGSATLQDLLNTPKDGNKYELVDGEIVVSPTGMRHSAVASNINALIWNFLQKNPIGTVYSSDVGIAFPNGNVRSPDVTYVSRAKLPGGESPETFGEVIPDLAVEVMRLFKRFQEVGVTIVVATHDVHLVRELGLREIVLDHGHIRGADNDPLAGMVATR